MNGTLFFTAQDGANGTELWKSDGTAAGTSLVTDIDPGSASSNPGNLTNVNGTLFFTTWTGNWYGDNLWEVWKSDGTAAGTSRVTSGYTHDEQGSSPTNLTNVNGTLFFTAYDDTHGKELWRSDGTATGTTMVKDIYPGGFWGGYYSISYHPNNSALTNSVEARARSRATTEFIFSVSPA